MSERDLTAGVIAELEGGNVNMAVFVKAVFDSGDIRLWTGIGPITFNSEIFLGIGQFGGIDRVEESAGDVKATGIAMTLSGIPQDKIALCLVEHFQNRPVTIWFAVLDEVGAIIPDAFQVFQGRMDYPVIEEGGDTATITVFAESILIDLERPRVARYTAEDQRAQYPDDFGLEFVASIQNKDIVWSSK